MNIMKRWRCHHVYIGILFGDIMGIYRDFVWGYNGSYPLVMTNIAIENCNLLGQS